MPVALLSAPEYKSGAVAVAIKGRTDRKPSRGTDEIHDVPHDFFHSTGELSADEVCFLLLFPLSAVDTRFKTCLSTSSLIITIQQGPRQHSGETCQQAFQPPHSTARWIYRAEVREGIAWNTAAFGKRTQTTLSSGRAHR